MDNKEAKNPFRFSTGLYLYESLGRKARDLKELIGHLNEVPSLSVYYHTHHFLQQHQYLSPEPPNDFAYWVKNVLGDKILGEKLFAIDILKFNQIEELGKTIIETIKNHIHEFPEASNRFASTGSEFYFMKSINFVLPLPFEAKDLNEFYSILSQITVFSIYYHMFDARLRLGKNDNDFSAWLRESLDEQKLAKKIANLDPYTHTMEELRMKICSLVRERI